MEINPLLNYKYSEARRKVSQLELKDILQIFSEKRIYQRMLYAGFVKSLSFHAELPRI